MISERTFLMLFMAYLATLAFLGEYLHIDHTFLAFVGSIIALIGGYYYGRKGTSIG